MGFSHRKHKTHHIVVLLLLLVGVLAGVPELGATTIRGVSGEGSAAVVGVTAEQGQRMALQSARANAIEKAAGVRVLRSTLVSNAAVVGDFFKSFSRGLIVHEQVHWLPLTSMQPTPDAPPIPVYRVKISADVALPEPHDHGLVLTANLNRALFRAGDAARLEIAVSQPSYIAIFNLMADDTVAMIYPFSRQTGQHILKVGETFHFPPAGMALIMQTLSGHEQDNEALWVVALPAEKSVSSPFMDLFASQSQALHARSYHFDEFNRRYSQIAGKVTEQILSYRIIRKTSGGGE